MSEEVLAQVTLCQLPNIGPRNIRRLISYAGSAYEALQLSKGRLGRIPGIGPKMVDYILDHERFKDQSLEIINTCQKLNINLLFYTHQDYPANLRALSDSPPLLYYRGFPVWKNFKSLAIVGTRRMTTNGMKAIDTILSGVKHLNPIILSGLAYGVDITAHRQALQLGLITTAVLGHGLDQVYPFSHRKTAEALVTQGALLSELVPGTTPETYHFPKRNRIIAGLADALVVVEAGLKGGALITAHKALKYRRPVYAVPGPLTSAASLGCHQLIRDGEAQILADTDDLMVHLTSLDKPVLPSKQTLALNPQQQRIYEALSGVQIGLDIDLISRQSCIPINTVATLLLDMEFKNVVRRLPGNKFLLSAK